MNDGLAALQKQDYKAASADFQAVIDSNKDNQGQLSTYAWYNLGVIAQTQNNLTEAITDYQKAVALTPSYLPALFNLATAQTAAGKYVEAAATYNAILVIRPKDANSMFNLGLLYYQNLGNQTKGRDLINQAIVLAPSLKTRVPSTVTLN